MRGAIIQANLTILEFAAGGIDDQALVDATSSNGKHIFTILVPAGAHAQVAEYAAVVIDQNIGMRSIHFPLCVKVREVVVQHIQMIGHAL